MVMSDIVCIGGWATTQNVWKPFIDCLGPGYKVTCVPWQDVLHRRHTVQNHALYIGWSLGGMLVLDVAARARACILVATTARITVDHGYIGTPLEVLLEMRNGLVKDKTAVLKRFFAASMFPTLNQKSIAMLLREADSIPVVELQRGLTYLIETDLRISLSRMKTPCTILHSQEDKIIPFSSGNFLAEHIPGAQIIACSGPGHAIPVSHPEMVASIVRSANG